MTNIANRQKRVGLKLALDVAGRDVMGVPFKETTHSDNVSGGGICFESARKMVIGTRLNLHIQVPAALRRHFGGRALYNVRAVVCRIEPTPDTALAKIGARFLREIDE